MKVFVAAIVASILLLVGGCSDNQKEDSIRTDLPYEERSGDDFVWAKLLAPQIQFFYQPDRMLETKAIALKDRIYSIRVELSHTLQSPQKGAIEFYCYKDKETLKKYTGSDTPFREGNRFFYGYDLTTGFAHLLSEYVLSNLPEPASYSFMAEGMAVLLDYSGHNYHQAADNLLADNELSSLRELTSNSTFDSLNVARRQVESASLLGYLMWEYGYEKVMQVYYSDKDFETTISEVFGIQLDKLESDWHAFLPENTNEKLEEREAAMQEAQNE